MKGSFYLLKFLVGVFTSSKFFAEELRITETKLAFFMGGVFGMCCVGWFFSETGTEANKREE